MGTTPPQWGGAFNASLHDFVPKTKQSICIKESLNANCVAISAFQTIEGPGLTSASFIPDARVSEPCARDAIVRRVRKPGDDLKGLKTKEAKIGIPSNLNFLQVGFEDFNNAEVLHSCGHSNQSPEILKSNHGDYPSADPSGEIGPADVQSPSKKIRRFASSSTSDSNTAGSCTGSRGRPAHKRGPLDCVVPHPKRTKGSEKPCKVKGCAQVQAGRCSSHT